MDCLSNVSRCPGKVRQQATMCVHVLACLISARTGVPSVSERVHEGTSEPHDSTSGQRHEPRYSWLLKVRSHNATWRALHKVCVCVCVCTYMPAPYIMGVCKKYKNAQRDIIGTEQLLVSGNFT